MLLPVAMFYRFLFFCLNFFHQEKFTTDIISGIFHRLYSLYYIYIFIENKTHLFLFNLFLFSCKLHPKRRLGLFPSFKHRKKKQLLREKDFIHFTITPIQTSEIRAIWGPKIIWFFFSPVHILVSCNSYKQ